MQSIDTKKIITGFLILAIFSGMSVFVFSGIFSSQKASQTQGIALEGQDPADPAAIADSAIGNATTDTAQQYTEKDDVLPTAYPTKQNLTDSFVRHVARSVAAQNPDGPSTAEDGTRQLAVPDDIAAVSTEFTDSIPTKFTPPLKTEKDVSVRDSFSNKDIEDYTRSLSAIIHDTFGADAVQNLQAKIQPGVGDPGGLGVASLVFEQASVRLQKMPVPKPFVALHVAAMNLAANQDTIFTDIAGYENDPVKAVVATNFAEQTSIRDFAKLQIEAKKAQKTAFNASSSQNLQSIFADALFFPRTAHASLFDGIVFDFSTEINTWGQFLKATLAWARKLATEIIKDQLIHRMTGEVIKWIQGGGKPQFITDWKGFLDQVGDEAAGLAIQHFAPGLCSSLRPYITLQLKKFTIGEGPKTTCTLTMVQKNLNAFYEDFRTGGWLQFKEMYQPNNNYFGSLIIGMNDVQKKKDAKTSAKNTEGQANKGFKGKEECVEWKTEKVWVPVDPDTSAYEGEGEGEYQDKKTCAKYQTRTPGDVFGSQLNQALGSPIHRIVNADDLTALASALFNSAIMKLMNTAKGSLTGMMSKDKNGNAVMDGGLGMSAIPGGVGGGQVCEGIADPEEKKSCETMQQTVASSTTGTEVSASDKQTVLSNISDLKTSAQQVVDSDAEWLALKDDVLSLLSQYATACPAGQGTATANMTTLTNTTADVTAEMNTASSTYAALVALATRAQDATDNSSFAAVSESLGQYSSTKVTAGTAKNRLSALKTLKGEIVAALVEVPITGQAVCTAISSL